MLVRKSFCLGAQDTDAINFTVRNKFIDTYPTSLLTSICEFLTFL